jgi:hypothetical protein
MWGIGIFLTLLLIFALLSPKLINLDPIRERIQASVSSKIGGIIECQHIILSFFPRPHLEIRQVSLSIPEKAKGTLVSISVRPKIMPLLKGQVQVSELQIEGPDFHIKLPKKREATLAAIMAEAASLLAPLALKAPDLVVVMKEGGLNLSKEGKTVFSFQDIHARITLPQNRITIHLTCNSNLWEGISAAGDFDPKDLTGKGQVDLKRLKPQALTGFLFPDGGLHVAESIVDLSFGFRTDGPGAIHAQVKGAIPHLVLQQANQELTIKGKSLKGAFSLDEDKTMVSLTELSLDYPQLTLTGRFVMDPKSPRIRLELEGREVDVHTTREAALALAGDNKITRKIFDYVKGGKIPLISLETQGDLPDDLGDLQNILIKANMLEGEIFVPPVDLDLKDVKGEVVIAKGILEGKDIEARVGNSWGREGTLKLGLSTKDHQFYLDTILQADLAQTLSLARRLVKNKGSAKELDLIDDLKGNALGRLVLSKGADSFRGNLAFQNGPNVAIDIQRNQQELLVKNLSSQDEESRASLTLNIKERALGLKFSGNLTQATLNKIFIDKKSPDRWIRGDFIADIQLDQPMRSKFQGNLKGKNLVFPRVLKVPLTIDSVSLDAEKDNVKVESLVFTWGDNQLAFEGDVNVSEEALLLDVVAYADGIEWENIRKTLDKDIREKDDQQALKFWDLPVRGTVRLRSGYLKYEQFTSTPFHADISLTPGVVSAAVTNANLCGIFCPGILKATPKALSLDFQMISKKEQLDHTVMCLSDGKTKITGIFDVKGAITASGKGKELSDSLHGDIEFIAHDGRIEHNIVLARTLALLNVTEVFWGKFPDHKEGLPYNSIVAKGHLQDGKLALKEVIIDGASMTITCQGVIDLVEKEVDAKVLVAPLKTVDRIIKRVPHVRDILPRQLVSVPVKVKGDLANPKVSPLNLSEVGSHLLGVMKRTLKAPVKLRQAIIPGGIEGW